MTTLEVRRVRQSDPEAAPLVAELTYEYTSRYGPSGAAEMQRPADVFEPPNGQFLLLMEGGVAVAGGAFKRRDEETAEMKRIWTHSQHRRRGLARRVLVELENEARTFGYSRIYLTTGPRQPEAKGLYLATGYTPLFDVETDPLTIGPLAFSKVIR
ncbi:GNAT family N-acetyltransferase [Lentzea jiangxiensis]|uniref:Acetyltransferase (GNAT) family protein n=1 Tax=Lentzea jiangxiensis TaxID=641025 RepID=A0A1H0F8F7_9PSEU|nr:GNAT family N-acetyltransferase [Lentzea jiangxiensis]SDN90934.1 Acetyltransferase (GNAT) family protein [Lentzea jiangxiensis]